MPRSNGVVVQNNFTKGLITDATSLAFPEAACTETNNCIFSPFGNVTRRSPLDFESSYTAFARSVSSGVVVAYVWTNVAGEGDITFVVVQIGDNLYFYRAGSDTALSTGKHATTIALSTFFPAGVSTVATLECQFSSGNGLLFVTNPRLESFYVTYDASANTFSTSSITIQIRDFEGDITDAETDTSRPTSTLAALNAHHRYNLENQGWTSATLTSWDTARADMPSNSDVSWYFKNTSDAFDFSTVADRAIGNSLAPKGHFIYSLYAVTRSGNISGATDYSISLDRLSTSAFFAGRVFYAGLDVAKENSKILFSQIIESPSQYGKCYQTNDPTSQELFDELPSDGGVIDLIEAGSIIKMIPFFNNLIVFCSNGVWAITGSQGAGFTATDYSIHRLAKMPLLSHTSFVDAEGTPYWWTNEGVFTVTADPQTNSLRVQCITDGAIRGFILGDIISESKLYVRGAYDPFSKTIQWIYKSRASESFNDKYVYDRLLTYSLLTKAWYPWSTSDSNVHLNAVVNVYGLSGTFEEVNITASAGVDNVVDSGNQVVAFIASSTGISNVNKYFVSYSSSGDKVTWAEHREDLSTFADWVVFDSAGEEYDSYFVTGYAVHGQAARKFQSNYIYVYSEVSDALNTSYKILGRWDFAVAASSGRWSTSQVFTTLSNTQSQTINVNADSFKTKANRIKIRGHGKACQFKIFNNSTNPFNIIGWSVFETGNQWI